VRRINQGFPVIEREERDRLVQLWFDQHKERRVMFDRLAQLTPRAKQGLLAALEEVRRRSSK